MIIIIDAVIEEGEDRKRGTVRRFEIEIAPKNLSFLSDSHLSISTLALVLVLKLTNCL